MSNIKYIGLEEANKLIYVDRIVRQDELILYLNRTNQWNLETMKKHNPKVVKDGKVELKVGKEKSGKVKLICPGHPTTKDNSTNLLVSSNKISCFRGGCICSKPGLNIIQFYLIFKLGKDAKVVLNPSAYKNLGREKFKAMAELLELKGYKIILTKQRKRLTREQKEQQVTQEILNKSADIYHEEFMKNEEGRKYFLEAEYTHVNENGEKLERKGRAFSYVGGVEFAIQQAKRFKVGFAPESFPATWLYERLAADYTTEELLRSSVVKWVEFKDENDKVKDAKPFDFHSYAMILPYWNRRNVTNLYSRAVDAPKEWRHLRLAGSVDVPIHFEEATEYEVVNVVEGENTWFTKILFGYENTLGNRGTNGLSEEHVAMLIQKREDSGGAYCKTIVLAFDGDKPGREATITSGKLLVEAGFDVRVVIMPEGMDQNDLLFKYKEKAKSVYEKIYSEQVSYFTFVALTKIKEESETTSDQLSKLSEIKQLIVETGITDETQLYLIAQEFSTNSNIPVDVIWSSWKKENKNIESLYTENYVFVTKDIETYYLLKFAFKTKAAYIEDTTFSFVAEDMIAKKIVADSTKYSEEELEQIQSFCDEKEIMLLTFGDLSEIIEVKIDNSALINQMLKH